LQLQANGLWENKTTAQVLGGTSSQFVKGDGTLDSTSYLPLIGGTLTGNLFFTGSAGIANPEFIILSKDGSNTIGLSAYFGWLNAAGTDGVYAQLNASNNLSFFGRTGSVNSAIVATIARDGNITANSFIKSGGTSSQYLMADGSVSTLSNPVTGTGSAGQVAYWSSGSAITGESNLFWDATNDRLGIGVTPLYALHIAPNNNLYLSNLFIAGSELNPILGSGGTGGSMSLEGGGLGEGKIYIQGAASGGNGFIEFLIANSQKLLIQSSGAAIFSSSVTASSLIKSGGTSSQYLMADGSVSTLTNPVTGTGTTNTLPKFTGSNTIGNSLFSDNGTNGGFGGTNYSSGTGLRSFNISAQDYPGLVFWANNQTTANIFGLGFTGTLTLEADPSNIFADTKIVMSTDGTERLAIFNNGNVTIGNSPSDAGFKLDVDGTGRFTGNLTAASFIRSGGTSSQFLKADGSVDSSSYVTGTGVSGQIAYFTGTSAITGESNLFWDSTNDRLGIGVDNPLSELQINKSSDVTLALSNSSSITTGNRGSIAWYNSSNSTVALIKATAITDNVGTELEFYTNTIGGSLIRSLILRQNQSAEFAKSLRLNGTLSIHDTDLSNIDLRADRLLITSDNPSKIRFGGRFNSFSYGSGAEINLIAVGNWSSTNYGANLTFSTVAENSTTLNTRMTISHNGNVGIGTASPVRTLNIYNNSTPVFAMHNSTTTVDANRGFLIYVDEDDTYIQNKETNGILAFITGGNTQRMKITSDGNIEMRKSILVGLDFSATQYIQISENQIYRTGNGTLFINNSATGNVSININGGETLVNGTNGYGRAVTNSSDERIKKNIKKIDDSLSKVLQMVGVYYEFDSKNQLCINVPSGKTRVGLIAQQIETILPEAVLSSNNETEPKSIDYNGLIGLLINAIQEQQEQINLLKN
jgi:hypothetical protein